MTSKKLIFRWNQYDYPSFNIQLPSFYKSMILRCNLKWLWPYMCQLNKKFSRCAEAIWRLLHIALNRGEDIISLQINGIERTLSKGLCKDIIKRGVKERYQIDGFERTLWNGVYTVYGKKNYTVMNAQLGIFLPAWRCQCNEWAGSLYHW